MSIFRRKPPARPTKSGEQGLTKRSSPALKALFDHLGDDTRPRVLDLGPACGENLAFFADRAGSLHVEDLYTTLRDRTGAVSRPETLLPLPAGTQFDVVLTWDLFNYLEPAELKVVAGHLRRLCSPGALLFAMAGYLAQIPDRPTRFRLVDTETLLYDVPSALSSVSHRYSTRDISQALRGFSLRTSFLLRNGYQEFLFVRDTEAAARAGSDSAHEEQPPARPGPENGPLSGHPPLSH
jgi:hypothetical protein